MSDISATPHINNLKIAIVKKSKIIFIILILLGWALIATWACYNEMSWREGNAFVTFVFGFGKC